MPYLIIAHDHPGMDVKREELREVHRTHLAAQGAKLLVSGALLSEGDNKMPHSSIPRILMRPSDLKLKIPYAQAGIRARVQIVKWRLRWWVGQFKTDGHHPSRD
jgi:uncharacterized protein